MLFLKNLTFFIRTQCTSNTTKKPFFHKTHNHHSAWWFVLDTNQKENPRLANLSTLSTYLIWNPGNCGQFVPWSAPDINVNPRCGSTHLFNRMVSVRADCMFILKLISPRCICKFQWQDLPKKKKKLQSGVLLCAQWCDIIVLEAV